ncbi:hypothetical protein SAMN05444388_106145 [Flavobacterium johnsoniae]|uniref:N-acetyltransferase domain-containing protein n=1 Tax=Flavobacterium johnsoniae TaxID=986 RepID=A0A1M5Q1M2_FLAJO|nr:hypothetical protein SAMN05444388_106145 [Flavobacterium johnsoniae]
MSNLKRTNSDDPDFINLVALLDKDLAIRDGDDHAFYNQFNKTDKIKHTIVYYENDVPVGCGAFREKESDKTEIKRMYVHPDYRKKRNCFCHFKRTRNLGKRSWLYLYYFGNRKKPAGSHQLISKIKLYYHSKLSAL